MKRKIGELIIILLFYLFQVTLGRVISIAGIMPNLLIIIPVIFGYFNGKNEGMFAGFFAGQLLQAVIVGTIVTVGMLIFGFPYAPMVGSAVGFCSLLPVIGSFIGGAVGFVMIAPLSINKALLFLLFLIILLQLMANFIYPKVVGRSIGMPGIWVFTSVIIGAGLGGIGGVLLGVPLAATIYKILREQVNKRNAANKQASETSKVCSETSQNEENQQETIG